MIKILNNTATRETLPLFLKGLAQQSLYDLSWTDPSLGVQDSAWWPEVNESLPLPDEFYRYGAETLTLDSERKVVVVTQEIELLTDSEIAGIIQSRRALMVVTMRQARLALLKQGLLASIQPAIDALDEPHRSRANIEWEYSQEVERNRPFVELLSQALGLTDDDLDALFELAATL